MSIMSDFYEADNNQNSSTKPPESVVYKFIKTINLTFLVVGLLCCVVMTYTFDRFKVDETTEVARGYVDQVISQPNAQCEEDPGLVCPRYTAVIDGQYHLITAEAAKKIVVGEEFVLTHKEEIIPVGISVMASIGILIQIIIVLLILSRISSLIRSIHPDDNE